MNNSNENLVSTLVFVCAVDKALHKKGKYAYQNQAWANTTPRRNMLETKTAKRENKHDDHHKSEMEVR